MGFFPHSSYLASTHTSMGWHSTPFCLLVSWSIPYSLFNILAGFSFLPGGAFCGVHHSIALPRPHSGIYILLPPCSSPVYVTLQFHLSSLPGPCFCPDWFHLLSLSDLVGNLWGLKPPVIQPQSCLLMRWCQTGPGNHQLPSSLENLWRPLLT